MVSAELFNKSVSDLIIQIGKKEDDNLTKAAEVMAKTIANGGVVHVFGTGHSVGLGIDMKNKIGSLIPIHIMRMNDFVLKGVVSLAEYTDKDNEFERRSGLAKDFIDLYTINPNDSFIIISNSGINGIVIDLALEARKRGHKVIVVTSMAHTAAEDSRHPSGKKLYQCADIVIDNCGPHGDALLPTDTVAKICSVSSICNNFIAQCLSVLTIDLLIEKYHLDPPVITGEIAHDEQIKNKYSECL